MSFQCVFKRYEIKYLLTKAQQQKLKELMSEFMSPDSYGRSTVCSLYFDTPDFLLIRRSLEKPVYKEKLRLRSYGVVKKTDTVFAEIKKKYKSVVYKRREAMTEKQAKDYFIKGIPPYDSQIQQEIDYFVKHYAPLMPAVKISYEREAFYSKTDHNFRITFDENILWRDYDLSLEMGIYGTPILSKGMVLMEVKTAGAIPLWLTRFLSENKIYKTSFSKYGNAYRQMCKNMLTGGKNYA